MNAVKNALGQRGRRSWKAERKLLIHALKACERRLCRAYEIAPADKYNPLPVANTLTHCHEAGSARKLLRECGEKL